jgi:hypothetical protein
MVSQDMVGQESNTMFIDCVLRNDDGDEISSYPIQLSEDLTREAAITLFHQVTATMEESI